MKTRIFAALAVAAMLGGSAAAFASQPAVRLADLPPVPGAQLTDNFRLLLADPHHTVALSIELPTRFVADDLGAAPVQVAAR